jgi:hypothetical protein
MAIETGALTAVLFIVTVILLLTPNNDPIAVALELITGRAYTNTLLYNLCVRLGLWARPARSHTQQAAPPDDQRRLVCARDGGRPRGQLGRDPGHAYSPGAPGRRQRELGRGACSWPLTERVRCLPRAQEGLEDKAGTVRFDYPPSSPIKVAHAV